jgi:septal ring factor EnvC (AmiA/AmiB activator)
MEPSELLEKLKGFTETKQEAKKESGSSSWIVAIVMVFVVLIGVFVFAWVANKNAKELAKLRHEKNKREIEEENAKVAAEAEKNDVKRAELEKLASETRAEIDKVDKAIKNVEAARDTDRAAIDSITSWNDI